jgi:uracil-DNA glycosylase family 4
MAATYEQLLDATIQHLEDLKSRGQRNIVVASEDLRALAQPAKNISPTSLASNLKSQNKISAEEVAPSLSLGLPMQTFSEPKRTLDPKEKFSAFNALRERALVCVKCPHLAASRKNVVFGIGNIDAQLMFVGEAPGADEDELGEPFVGRAGELLTKIIQATGLSRGEVYIANILKCRPDTPGQNFGNRKPTPEEMATCIPYLHEQIDLIRPKVLVALGGVAIEALLGKGLGITKLRGQWQNYRGTPLMPTYHPAYLLRNQSLSEKRKVWEDFLQVMAKLEMPVSEKQGNYFLK